MLLRDYNGQGNWTGEAIQTRYAELARQYGVVVPRTLKPVELVRGDIHWIYPVMDQVIDGIKAGDVACAALGVAFLEEDAKFPFGANLKARTARALRQSELPAALNDKLRHRIVEMLLAGNTPREYREYARLLRKIGFGDLWQRLAAEVPRHNKYAMRYFSYFLSVHERAPAVVANEC
jgi:hypothetical protein